jgi:hypothetical protein
MLERAGSTCARLSRPVAASVAAFQFADLGKLTLGQPSEVEVGGLGELVADDDDGVRLMRTSR